MVESGDQTLGAGGAVLGGDSTSSATATLSNAAVDLTSDTDTVVDKTTGSGSETDVVGGDTAAAGSSPPVPITPAITTPGPDTDSLISSSDAETVDEQGSETDREADALATDAQDDQETVTETTLTSVETDYPTAMETAAEVRGPNGTISTGNDWSTEYDHNSTTLVTTIGQGDGTESYGDTSSESEADGSDEDDDAPTDDMSGGFDGGDTVTDYATAYESSTDALGYGGTITGGFNYESRNETDTDTSNDSEGGTDTSGDSGHDSHQVGTANQSSRSNDTGMSSSSLGDEGSTTATVTTTSSETLGNDGVVSAGDESFTTYEYSGDAPTLDEDWATDTGTISYADGALPDDTISSTETITDSPDDNSTLQLSGTATLGTSGSIVAGSQTQTLDSESTDLPSVVGGTGTEDDSDTAGTILGLWTPAEAGGSNATLHEVETDTLATLGSIAGGTMDYSLTYGSSDSDDPTETGQESVSGQIGEPADEAGYDLDSPESFSYSSSEQGTVTLGTLGTITSGSDSYTWDEYRSSGVTRNFNGASIEGGETGTDTYGLQESGTEFEGVAGVITSGSDDFTWDQAGSDEYSLTQEGTGTITMGGKSAVASYYTSVDDYVTSSWSDTGRDQLGASDSIVGGSDDYSWDRTHTLDFGDDYDLPSIAADEPDDISYGFDLTGDGSEGFTLADRGGDEQTGSVVVGHDSYTDDSTSLDDNALDYDRAGNSSDEVIDLSGRDSFSLHDVGDQSDDDGDGLSHTVDHYTITHGESVGFHDRIVGGYSDSSSSFGYVDDEVAHWSFSRTMTLAVGSDGDSSFLDMTSDEVGQEVSILNWGASLYSDGTLQYSISTNVSDLYEFTSDAMSVDEGGTNTFEQEVDPTDFAQEYAFGVAGPDLASFAFGDAESDGSFRDFTPITTSRAVLPSRFALER